MKSRRPWAFALGLAGLGLLASSGARAVTPVGPEFQVNTHTSSNQNAPSVAMSPTGAFVVTWESQGQDGDGSDGVFARRYASSGIAQASEFQVTSYTVGDQSLPAISTNEAGGFVVVWESAGQDGAEGGIFARRFGTAGEPLDVEFRVNAHTVGDQGAPDVAMGPSGGFIVVWESLGQDGDDFGIFGRRHNASGTPQAAEFQVNLHTSGVQRGPSIAITTPGELIVVWRGVRDGGGYEVFGRRIDSGELQGDEFQINAYTSMAQTLSAIAGAPDGTFAVVWQSPHDGAPAGIFGRRFDSVGAPLGAELQINAYTAGTQTEPDLATGGAGFVAVWQSAAEDGDSDGIFARRATSSGALQGAEFQVNTYTINGQRDPGVGMDADGDFVVVWRSFLQDGSADGVFAQRFSALDLVALDVDGNGATEALTDGLLVLRFLFGFTGTTLTAGAVDLADCARCDAAAIVPYLTGLGLVLDVDDDDELGALTDGLLVLRFLFGFTGTTLTTGAVDLDACERCDAVAIEPYLQSLI